MNKILGCLALIVCVPLLMSANFSITSEMGSSSYDIAEIYEKVELKSGAKVVTNLGDVESAEAVLIPTKVDVGKYEVELTRVDANFYRICGTSLYIETKYCYEYASMDDAILNITSNYGYTRGEVIFLD